MKSSKKNRGIAGETENLVYTPRIPLEEHKDNLRPPGSLHHPLYSNVVEEEDDAGEDALADLAMSKRAEFARIQRTLLRKEEKIDEFISLENVTQQGMDEEDISLMVNQHRGFRPRQIGWEDPDDIYEGASKEEHMDTDDSGEGREIDDGLDREAFAAHEGEYILTRALDKEKNKGEDTISAATLEEYEEGYDTEEMRAWEVEQISKGMASGLLHPTTPNDAARKATRALYSEAQEKSQMKIPRRTLEEIAARLTSRLASTQEQLLIAHTSLTQLHNQIQEARATLRHLEEEQVAAREKQNPSPLLEDRPQSMDLT